MSDQFQTPVGRIVWGNPAKSTIKKDQQSKQPVLRDGQQVQQWAFGLAIPKAEFDAQVRPHLEREAHTIFPNGVPGNFSWKYKDGDSVDKNGKPYSDREGYGGCYIMTISTEAFAPSIYKFENGAYREISEGEIKCGDFVSVSLNLKANKPANNTHTPGIYVNPNGVLFVAYGTEIVSSGQDPDEMFTQTNFNLPQGASATPVNPMPQNGSIPNNAPQQQYQTPGQPAQQYNTPPAQQPVQQAPQQQYAQPQYQAPGQPLPDPAHDFVQNAGQQPQQQYNAPPAQQPVQQAPQQQYAQPGTHQMPGQTPQG